MNVEIVVELPDRDTSYLSNDSGKSANYSRFCAEESHLFEEHPSGFTSYDSEPASNTNRVPTFNKTNGFKRAFVAFKGSAPDYRSSKKSVMEYFFQFCNKSMIGHISSATNLYAARRECVLNVTCEEIEQYIGILLHMGVFRMPDYRDYWKPQTRYPPIADVMPRNRFDQIKSNFHICDNTDAKYETDTYDRLLKVRKLYDHVQMNCMKLDVPEYLSIGWLIF